MQSVRNVAGALAAALLAAGMTRAETYQGNPANYRSLLAQLQPGDTLQLSAGTYVDQLPISDLHGTPAAWIRIQGPASGAPAVFLANDCCNTVQFDGASYIEVSHLTLDGAGTNGPFGVDSRGITHHITISDLLIINYGADQSMDGISTKGPAWNWIIRRNRIIGAGTGMYLGSSDGGYPFVAGLIEYNVVLDSAGYNLQIKHQNPRPTGVGMPTGVNRTIIRHNVFSKANNASFGDLARPNVLVGHLPLTGDGQDDVYEIYGNFFHENPSEALFQGEGNIGLYANVFVTTTGDAVNIVPHNAVPRQVTVFQNTVLAAGRGIRVNGGDSRFTQQVIGNAVFAATPISAGGASGNITDAYAAAHLYTSDPYAPVGELDLYPLAGALRDTALSTTPFSAYTDWNLDFNGRVRDPAIRGAYGGEGANPGWRLALEMKTAGHTGGAGSDMLTGTPGDDVLNGLGGADTMTGLAGDDLYYVENAGDLVVEQPAEGNDRVRAAISYVLPANVENLTLTGTAASNGGGNALANSISGNGAANALNGRGGADALAGNAGADRLNGGPGSDRLRGDAGKDTFVFDVPLGPTNVDRVIDFAPGEDVVRLASGVFTGLSVGPLPPDAFRIGTGAADAGDRIVYNSANGALFFDSDGNGSTPPVRFATLASGLALSHADFLVQ